MTDNLIALEMNAAQVLADEICKREIQQLIALRVNNSSAQQKPVTTARRRNVLKKRKNNGIRVDAGSPVFNNFSF